MEGGLYGSLYHQEEKAKNLPSGEGGESGSRGSYQGSVT